MIKTIPRTGPLPSMFDARFSLSHLYDQARGRAQTYLTAANLLADLDADLSKQFRARATTHRFDSTCLLLIGKEIDAAHIEALAENEQRPRTA